jgi:hypothetical protein
MKAYLYLITHQHEDKSIYRSINIAPSIANIIGHRKAMTRDWVFSNFVYPIEIPDELFPDPLPEDQSFTEVEKLPFSCSEPGIDVEELI